MRRLAPFLGLAVAVNVMRVVFTLPANPTIYNVIDTVLSMVR